MALDGIPLIAVTMLASAVVASATILCWPRFGRWRPVSRTVGVLLSEVLAVLSVGLIVNRHEQFYPSWQALTGNTGTATTTAQRPPARLDGAFAQQPAIRTTPWQPAGAGTWGLSAPAQLTVPSGYAKHATVSYPVLLTLGGRSAATDVVGVTVDPTTRTTAAALAGLPALLRDDVRVTTHGWALAASAAQARLAAQLIDEEPGRFAALVVVGATTPVRPRPDLAIAEVPAKGVAVPPGVTGLTGGWRAANAWAAAQTAAPLVAPQVLPQAVVS
jgi:hypothetical protein